MGGTFKINHHTHLIVLSRYFYHSLYTCVTNRLKFLLSAKLKEDISQSVEENESSDASSTRRKTKSSNKKDVKESNGKFILLCQCFYNFKQNFIEC